MEKEEENREMAEEEMEVKERGRRSSWRRWRRKRRWRRRVRRGGGGEGWKGDGRGGKPSHGVLDRLEPSVGEQHMVSALRVPGVAATIRLSDMRTFLFQQSTLLFFMVTKRYVWSAPKFERVKLFFGGSWRFNKDRWQRRRDKSAQVAFSNSKALKEENSQYRQKWIFSK